MAVELAIGLITSALMLVSFVGILWTLSGPLHVALGADRVRHPRLHGLRRLALCRDRLRPDLADRPADGRAPTCRRNEAESDHRFALVRIRESAEGVALIRGEADEERGLRQAFGAASPGHARPDAAASGG